MPWLRSSAMCRARRGSLVVATSLTSGNNFDRVEAEDGDIAVAAVAYRLSSVATANCMAGILQRPNPWFSARRPISFVSQLLPRNALAPPPSAEFLSFGIRRFFSSASTLISPVAGQYRQSRLPHAIAATVCWDKRDRRSPKAITWPKAQRKTSNVKSASGTINCYTMLSTDLGCHPLLECRNCRPLCEKRAAEHRFNRCNICF